VLRRAPFAARSPTPASSPATARSDALEPGRPDEPTVVSIANAATAAVRSALTVVTRDAALTADAIRSRLPVHEKIVHSTIEVHRLPGAL